MNNSTTLVRAQGALHPLAPPSCLWPAKHALQLCYRLVMNGELLGIITVPGAGQLTLKVQLRPTGSDVPVGAR